MSIKHLFTGIVIYVCIAVTWQMLCLPEGWLALLQIIGYIVARIIIVGIIWSCFVIPILSSLVSDETSSRVTLRIFPYCFAIFFIIYYLSNSAVVLCESLPDPSASDTLVLNHLLGAIRAPTLEGQLGPYLAGLIESDGAIVVPNVERGLNGQLDYPTVQISFHGDEYPFAIALKDTLGYGSVNKASSSHC